MPCPQSPGLVEPSGHRLAGNTPPPARRQQRLRLLAAAVGLAATVSFRLRGACPTVLLGPLVAADAGSQTSRCEAVRAELADKLGPRITQWEKAATEGRTISGFGNQASRLINKTLATFDQRVRQELGDGGDCKADREALEKSLQRQLHSIFLVQRSTIEQVLYQRLKKELLHRMRRKHRELDVKEKLRLLGDSMKEYDYQVRDLVPVFVANPERDRAERRLSELQWGILDTPEGKEMQQRWKMEKMRRMPMRQSKGFSISLSPGMRLMFRPGGFGNMQVYSKRQVGPPHNPNEISIAMLNDGNVIDVYNKKPQPPLIKFQPTIGVDISTG